MSEPAQAAKVHQEIEKLLAIIDKDSALGQEALSFQHLLQESYDVRLRGRGRPRNSNRNCVTKETLLAKNNYLKAKIRRLSKEDEKKNGAREGMRLANSWKIRTCLSDPIIPARTLASLFAEWNFCEARSDPLSHTSITTVRDAFCEVLKKMTAQKGRLLVSQQSGRGDGTNALMVLSHSHDGADMKMRSYDSSLLSDASLTMPSDAPTLSRARSSKIQNHSLSLICGQKNIPWFCELQPMSKKDAASVATSIIKVITGVLEATVSTGGKYKLLHMMTGDSINTNTAAARMVLHWFLQQSPFRQNLLYRLLWLRCAAHKANLVTVTAITGRTWAGAFIS